MSAHSRAVLLGGVAALGVLGASVGAVVTAAKPAPVLAGAVHYGFSGNAFGSRMQAGGDAGSGRSAWTTLGCTTRTGVTRSNSTEQSQQSSVGAVGSVATSTATRRDGDTESTTSSATVHGFSLLNGQVHATSLQVNADATHVGPNGTSGSTTFQNLTVAGHAVDSTPKPDQTQVVPGVGTLVLNDQRATHDSSGSRMTINGLELRLAPGNAAHLPANTDLVLAHATAAITSVGYLPLTGSSYGTAVLDDSNAHSGHSFAEPMPCGGDTTARNSGAGTTAADALRTGSIVSSATSHDSGATTVSGTTTSTVQNVHLLGGLVTATAVKASAAVRDHSGHVATDETGSHFTGLRVNGKALPAKAKPNTRINLGSVGTLWLNRVVRTTHGITVHMIDLHFAQPTDGVASGSDLVVANARAGVHR